MWQLNITHASIFVFTPRESWGVFAKRLPPELLPVANRPFLEWILIWLSDHGVRAIHLYVSDHVNQFASFLNTGSKWGISVTISAVPSEQHALERLLADLPQTGTLVIDGGCFPLERELPAPDPSGQLQLLGEPGFPRWLLLPYADKAVLSGQSRLQDVLQHAQAQHPQINDEFASCADSASLLRANEKLLASQAWADCIPGHEIESRIFAEAGIVLHPTCRVEPVSCIGEYSSLGRGVLLRTGSALGAHVIVGDLTVIDRAIVLPHTALGESLKIKNCILDRNCLIRQGSNHAVIIPDSFFAGEGRLLASFRLPPLVLHYLVTLIFFLPMILFFSWLIFA